MNAVAGLDRVLAAFSRGAGLDAGRRPGCLWEAGGWRCTLEHEGRVRLDGPQGRAVAYDLPGVDLTACDPGLTTVGAVSARPADVATLELRGAAKRLFHRSDPEIAISGPAGTGKSLPALMRAHLAAIMYPGAKCLVARKVAATLGATTLATFERKVADRAIAAGLTSWYGGSTREPASYRYPNGSSIAVGGLDKPIKIMSAEYDLVFVDEATEVTVADWEAITTRLRNGMLPWQQQVGALNPAHPTHWLKQRSDSGAMPMLASYHRDNPAYFRADGTPTPTGASYLEKLGRLTGVRKLRLRDGLWVAAEGIVYEEWRDDLHLVDALPAGSETWTRWWAVDFGYTNPFCCQWWAQDPDGRLWMYREIYHTKRLVEDHARAILAAVTDEHGRWVEPRPRAIICDHDAEDRATLERHLKMPTVPANKAVKTGIEAVQVRLRPAGDGRPRLFLVRGAPLGRDPELAEARKPVCTAEEVPGYVWDKTKEAPVKNDDHGMDPMRYVVAELDLAGRPRVRWM